MIATSLLLCSVYARAQQAPRCKKRHALNQVVAFLKLARVAVAAQGLSQPLNPKMAMEKGKRKRLRTQETTPEEQRSRHSKHRRIDSSQVSIYRCRKSSLLTLLSQAGDLKAKLESKDADLKEVHALRDDGYGPLLAAPSLSPEIEKALWKAHHAKITEFRSQMQRAAEKQKSDRVGKKTLKNVVAPLIDFIASSSNFYSELVSRVRVRHGLGGTVSDSCDKSLDESEAREFRETCHRLLLRLGDLARYKEVYGVSLGKRNYSTAEDYYVQASRLCHCEGGAHGQLAILATHAGDRVRAVYHYLRSLFVKMPSPTSHSNLLLLLESKSDAIAEASQGSSNFDNLLRLFEILLLKTGFDNLQKVLDGTLNELERSVGTPSKVCDPAEPTMGKVFLGIQIVTILACSIEDFHLGLVCKTSPPRSSLHETLACAFKVVRTLAAIGDPTMLPALVIFTAGLAGSEDTVRATAESDELRRSFLDALERAESFFQALSVFSEESLSRLSMSQEELTQGRRDALWEDHELQGFVPLGRYHESLNFGFHYLACDSKQLDWKRLRRLEASLRALAEMAGLSKDTTSSQAETVSTSLGSVLDRQLAELKVDTGLSKNTSSSQADEEAATISTNLSSAQLDDLKVDIADLSKVGFLNEAEEAGSTELEELPVKFSPSLEDSFFAKQFLKSVTGSTDLVLLEQAPEFPESLEDDHGQGLRDFEDDVIPFPAGDEGATDNSNDEDLQDDIYLPSQSQEDALNWRSLSSF
ncbi:protein SMG7 isoform X1 [Selaginella moellendorffii]|uniref:protein SMG7 isoform X1 n=1 Tax=Selaginella moellendorffii TaxID=88036 RepID=UPI000D1C8F24|nr:protein SMG7 isoform X1 [Selaginella moellendorffii]|eukprot:XP_024538323.1 protein SMG7 isoform X1 [Selaginella moellendorffii]